MTRIGLLSDTHSFLDPAILKHFKKCDEIWHAGDIGNESVLDQLKAFKPTVAVYGNIDSHIIRKECSLHHRFTCEDVDVWITHIGGYPRRYSPFIQKEIETNPPQLFICGHSHILKIQFDKTHQVLFINPGAMGKQGFHKVRTMVRFELSKGKIKKMEVIEVKR